jgi:DNA-binding transcriptional LysR family regulator
VVPAIAAAFREAHPDLGLRTRAAQIEGQLAGLRARSVDVGLFQLSRDMELSDDLSMEDIVSAPMYVALSPGHPFAEMTTIRLEEMANEPWIAPMGYYGDVLRAACARHGFAPRIVQEADTVDTAHGLVAAGFGVSVGTWLFALRPSHDMALRPVQDEVLDVVAAYLPPRTPAIGAFLEVAREVIGRFRRDID